MRRTPLLSLFLMSSWNAEAQLAPIPAPPASPFQNTALTISEASPGAVTAATVLFDMQRPMDRDLVVLATGDELFGDVLEERMSIQTPYAELRLPINRVAGLDRGDPGTSNPRHFETLVAVNGDEFSGLGLEPKIRFRLETGQELVIARELIHRILFRQRPNEGKEIPRRQHFLLRGGDHFSGALRHAGPLRVRTAFAELALNLAEVEAIVLPREDVHGRVTMLTGTDTAGDADLDEITAQLDILEGLVSEPVRISAERVAAIFPQPGAIPNPELLERVSRSRTRSVIADAVELEADGTAVAGTIIAETDSYYFQARQGSSYDIQTQNVSNLDTFLRLVGMDGATMLAENDDGGVAGLASRVQWVCPESGLYYVQVWRLGMGPGQAQPGVNYGYTPGNYEVFIREQ